MDCEHVVITSGRFVTLGILCENMGGRLVLVSSI